MSALYLHIPFCRRACYYCDFHFSTSLRTKPAVLKAILLELESRSPEATSRIQSIYFGGGTPSLLQHNELMSLFDHIFHFYDISPDAEITLEANPDDLTSQRLKELRNTPVNRLSIGVQSFHDSDLKYMNRIHSAKDAEYAIKRAQDIGFANLSIDLIYGIPTLTDAIWVDNLQRLILYQVPHISAYALTIEEHTPLHHLIRRKKTLPPVEEHTARHFKVMSDLLSHAGFVHYEISNFAQPGYQSRHNSSYWAGLAYIGIGPSAHSYDGYSQRRWNVANNVQYIKGVNEGGSWFEMETLNETDKWIEFVMISLRRADGIKKKDALLFGEQAYETLIKRSKDMPKQWFYDDSNALRLTLEGMLMSDYIILNLIK